MKNFKNRKADIELTYKTVNNLHLPIHVFLPDGDVHDAQTILAIHGGGWNDAIKDNAPWEGGWMANNARYLAEKGFVGVVISYRSLTVSDQLNVSNLFTDCVDAIKYIKTHLTFINFDNIIYMGDSAGGYLATMLGLSQDDEIRPKSVVSLNPVLGSLDNKWLYGFRGCSDIDNLTPSKMIGDKCADFLFIHGTADKIVDMKYTEELNGLLNRRGHRSKLIKIPDAEHAFILYDYKYSDEYVTNIMEQIIDYIDKNF